MQEAYGKEQISLIRAGTTRWLSHGKTCIRFIDVYESCIDALDTIYELKKEPEVHGLRCIVTNKNTLQMILLLCDVLRPVNILSAYLQINFMDVESKAKATINELDELVTLLQNGSQDIYFSKVEGLIQIIDDRTSLLRRLRADTFMQPQQFLQSVGVPFINSLMVEINDAFTCHPVIKAFQCLDPRRLPNNLKELTDHRKVKNTLISFDIYVSVICKTLKTFHISIYVMTF